MCSVCVSECVWMWTECYIHWTFSWAYYVCCFENIFQIIEYLTMSISQTAWLNKQESWCCKMLLWLQFDGKFMRSTKRWEEMGNRAFFSQVEKYSETKIGRGGKNGWKMVIDRRNRHQSVFETIYGWTRKGKHIHEKEVNALQQLDICSIAHFY